MLSEAMVLLRQLVRSVHPYAISSFADGAPSYRKRVRKTARHATASNDVVSCSHHTPQAILLGLEGNEIRFLCFICTR